MINYKKLACVLTMIREEKEMFPIWEKYYGILFGFKNLFVINNSTKDKSLHHSKSNILNYDNEYGYDEQARNMKINQTQIILLKKYKYVIFADADEIIIPNLLIYKNLFNYIKICNKKRIACNGYEVLHKNCECKIDETKSIFSQRIFWKKDNLYNKPCIVREKTNWNIGLHTCTEKVFFDENLYLVHLRRYDKDFCLNRQMWKFNLKCKFNDDYDVNHAINGLYKMSNLTIEEKYKKALNFCDCEKLTTEKIPTWLIENKPI